MQKATIKLTWLFVLGVFMLAFQQAKAQCNADFTFTVNDTTRVVQFTNTSTPTADSVYQWYFGSGGYSTLKNPSYQFPAAGTYMVCLYYFANNCFDSTCKLVVIDSIAGNSCSANFSFLVNQTTKTVTFNNFSTGPDSNYIWQFGDNSNSTAKNPVHTYGSAGSYTVCLTKTGPVCYDTICKTIVITNPPCDANFTFSVNQSTRTVTFTNTSTGASDSLYQWYFGDNTTSGVKHPVKTYSANGTYLVCLFKNGPTCFDSVCKTVVISQPCDANFIFSVNQSTRTVTFTNTSTGPGDSLYQWSFGDNTSSGVKHPVKTYSANGTYLVCLFKNGPTCFDSVCKTVVISQPCDANFTFSVNHTTRTVTFNNTSTAPDSIYLWNFGDNTSSGLKNPSKTYSSDGVYTVCLYKHGPCYDSICKTVTILPDSCNADFTYSINHSTTTVTFTNLSTGYPDSMYQWYFGSTGSSTLKNPVHNFGAPGTYMVCLYKFGNNCWDSTCKVITILPDSCNADFTYSVTPGTTTVTFNNLSTGYPDSMYQWYFGSTGSSTLKNPVHNFGAPGTYMVCLYKFGNNCWDSTCKVITILPDSCNADFTYSINHSTRTVTFNNLSTGYPDSSYLWYFGNQGTSTQKNPVFTFGSAGTYLVCLYKFGNNCWDSTCKVITIDSMGGSCQASFTYTYNPSNGSLYFNNTSTGGALTYQWTFGGPNGSTSTAKNPSYHYPYNGTYLICLTVTRSNPFCTSTFCDTITISQGPNLCRPYVNMSPDSSDKFRYMFFAYVGGSGTQYFWDFGDGDSSTQQSPQHTYSQPGTYFACVTTVRFDGCISKVCDTIVIPPDSTSPCEANFSYVLYPDSMDGVNRIAVFTNLSNGSPYAQYFWTFGDGGYSTQVSPIHYYGTNNMFWVNLMMYDSINNCIDSSGQWIYIGPDTTTGLADAAAILHDVNVYPVPFNEIVKVRFTSRTDKPVAVKIYNTIGILQHRETREAVAGTNEYEINAERLARGIYFIELSTDTGTITKRIIK